MDQKTRAPVSDSGDRDPAGAWNPGPIQFAPGVVLKRARHADEYVGTAAALVAAGVCREDQLPGKPGRGKTMCTYFPDGSPKNRSGSTPAHDGTKQIIKKGGQFLCEIRLKRTGHALEYWKQIDAQQQAKWEARRQEEAARRNKEEESRVCSAVDPLYVGLSEWSEERLDWWLGKQHDHYLESVRLVERIKADRRQAQLLIDRTEGAVIFPKVWQ